MKSKRFLITLVLLLSPVLVLTTEQGFQQDLSQHQGGLRPESLVIKNQIGYHFKKTVSEVTQELFILGRINMSAYLTNLAELSRLADKVKAYCGASQKFWTGPSIAQVIDVPDQHVDYDANNPCFHLIPEVSEVTRAEAKAVCASRGLRLPELYTETERVSLATFLTAHQIKACFAGLEMDLVSGFPRYLSTGLPVWKGVHNSTKSTMIPTTIRTFDQQLDKLNTEYIYTDSGEMHYHEMGPEAVAYHGLERLGTFYSDQRVLAIYEFRTRVVCSPHYTDGLQKYDWLYFDVARKDHLRRLALHTYRPGGDTTLSYGVTTVRPLPRHHDGIAVAKPTTAPNPAISQNPGDFVNELDNSIVSLCDMISLKLEDVAEIDQKSLQSTLSMAGIDTYDLYGQQRDQRALPALAKIVLRSGLGLFGELNGLFRRTPQSQFISKTSKSVDKLTEVVKASRGAMVSNQENLELLIRALRDSALPIDPVDLATPRLRKLLDQAMSKADMLNSSQPAYRSTVMTSLTSLADLTTQISMELNARRQFLSDIIHQSLAKATSPLLLTKEQLTLVTNQLRRRSISATLGTDIYRQPSSIMIDPDDKNSILVIVNAAAYSPEKLELMQLLPIPFFESDQAFEPILDYEFVVLNQLSGVFRALTPQEAVACLDGPCYVSGMEMSINSLGCGLPQYFERHSEACEFTSSTTLGMYLRSVPPDGVVYSFQNQVDAQLFCGSNNLLVGNALALQGIGVIYVPPGCSMTFDDRRHPTLRVKGTPNHHLVEAPDLSLVSKNVRKIQQIGRIFKKPRSNGTTASFPELLLTIKQNSDRNKDELILLHAKMWGCLAFVTLLLGFLLLMVQVTYQRARTMTPKSTFKSFEKDLDVKLDEIGKLKATVTFLKSMVHLEQLSLRESSLLRSKNENKGTSMPLPFSKMAPNSRAVSQSANCVSMSSNPPRVHSLTRGRERGKSADYNPYLPISPRVVRHSSCQPIMEVESNGICDRSLSSIEIDSALNEAIAALPRANSEPPSKE